MNKKKNQKNKFYLEAFDKENKNKMKNNEKKK